MSQSELEGSDPVCRILEHVGVRVIKAAPAGGPCHASMENGWNSERLNTFAFFLAERERIRRGKESGGPPPWTQDFGIEIHMARGIL